MAEEIKRCEALSDAEKQQLFGWGEDIFGVTSLGLRWRPKDLHFLLYRDGSAVSHVGLLRHVVRVGGEPVTVGGVGGVVTIPAAQGKGFARGLLGRAVDFFGREWGADAGLLFCLGRMVPFYESMGWNVVDPPVLIEQPAGKVASPLPVMALPCGGRGWPNGQVELDSLPW
ncbi:MAG: GNAT family N-acetyltransferase [Pyrinomonadaceae bacterium]